MGLYSEIYADELPEGVAQKSYDVSIKVSGKAIEGATVAIELEGEGSLAPDEESLIVDAATNADGYARFSWHRLPQDDSGDLDGTFRAWCAIEQCLVAIEPVSDAQLKS